MKMILSIGAVLTAAVVGWAGMSARAVTRAGTPTAVTARDDAAAALYAANCAKCHGTDGRARTPRGRSLDAQDFTSAKWKAKTSVEDAAATIRDGYQEMPSYKKRLTGPQIQSLAEYVKGFPR